MQEAAITGTVVKGHLVEPAVCFSHLLACEELIHSFIRQKANNIMLRQQTFFNICEPKISIYDMTILLCDLDLHLTWTNVSNKQLCQII